MPYNTSSRVLKLSGKEEFGTAYIQFFHQGESQLMLANNADDKVIIPYDLLPESQQDCGMMVRVVDAVRHLVDTIRNLEAQRDWLAEKASEQYAELYKYKNSILAPVCYTSAAQWKYFAEEATKEAGK